MANGFDYESPLNRLLSVTLPQFVNNERNRQESSRRFDEQMAAQADARNQQQFNFEQQQRTQEDNIKFNQQRALRMEELELDQFQYKTADETTSISGEIASRQKLKGTFKTQQIENTNDSQIISLQKKLSEGKKAAEIFREDDPNLADILLSNADNPSSNNVSVINSYFRDKQIKDSSLGVNLYRVYEANFNKVKQLQEQSIMPNSGITAEMISDARAQETESLNAFKTFVQNQSGTADTILRTTPQTSIADGSIENPFIYQEGDEFKRSLKEGSIVKALSNDGQELLLEFTSEGDFVPAMDSTPEVVEYKEEVEREPVFIDDPEIRQEAEGRLGELGEPFGFLERAAGEGSVLMRYSPKESYKATKNFEDETYKLVQSMRKSWMDSAQKSPGMYRAESEDLSANQKYQDSAMQLQNLVRDGYNMYLTTAPNTKGGKILRKKLKKTLGRLKSRVQKGSKLYGVDLTGNQDLVDLLVSIEL